MLTLLQLFDAPALVGTCSTRTTSTVPLQSLALLNSDFVRARVQRTYHAPVITGYGLLALAPV